MSPRPSPEDFGEPLLELGAFKLWVHGGADVGDGEYGDARWLDATVHCSTGAANAWAQGSILQVSDLRGFGDGCARLMSGAANLAHLSAIETNVRVWLQRADDHGHYDVRVWIAQEPTQELHSFRFEVDQSYLPKLISVCERITGERRGGEPACSAAGWPAEGKLTDEQLHEATEELLRAMVGRPIDFFRGETGRWRLGLGSELHLDVQCPWRILEGGRVRLGHTDAELPGAPDVDVRERAFRMLAGRRISALRMTRGTLDLRIELGPEFCLEVLPDSSVFEAWEFSGPGGRGCIAVAGGTICLI